MYCISICLKRSKCEIFWNIIKAKMLRVQWSVQYRTTKTVDFYIILSIGSPDPGNDRGTIRLNWVFQQFNAANCAMLRDKPKWFIIQACRGSMLIFFTWKWNLKIPIIFPHWWLSLFTYFWTRNNSSWK